MFYSSLLDVVVTVCVEVDYLVRKMVDCDVCDYECVIDQDGVCSLGDVFVCVVDRDGLCVDLGGFFAECEQDPDFSLIVTYSFTSFIFLWELGVIDGDQDYDDYYGEYCLNAPLLDIEYLSESALSSEYYCEKDCGQCLNGCLSFDFRDGEIFEGELLLLVLLFGLLDVLSKIGIYLTFNTCTLTLIFILISIFDLDVYSLECKDLGGVVECKGGLVE
ncbi:MAG: hypothetical protein EZS28_009599 [Streblomastix strix]|uniref:Uncharacterized protein n=1 Tax=Streblomastix strix TaxID=222440 RepID=A0A5J4WKK2_9EUKA|nr:MAG: hypothetical protein EZS28_009599 [Streblomastix strix]